MALIRCPECNKEISDTAISCPHCGYILKPNTNKSSKKRKGCFTWILFLIALILAALYFYSRIGTTSLTKETNNDKVLIENVRISKDYSNAWAVKGSVKNNTTHSIKGAVKINFLNSNGDIVFSNRAYVNDGKPFGPGQSATFEYFDDPKTFDGVTKFKVEFYER